MKQLKIFLVYRTDGVDRYSDEYDSFVVVTTDENRAKELNPEGKIVTDYYHKYSRPGDEVYKWGAEWSKDQNKIKVELIGTANRHETAERIVCASFNAG